MAVQGRTVVVYGATGQQGGAVTRSLLRSSENFTVRAITRNPSSAPAQELSRLGAQVVQADGFNTSQMLDALKGAWGFWLNTDHQDPVFPTADGIDDTAFGSHLIDLAAKSGVKVLIYSTCESTASHSHGKVVVPGMDNKARVLQHGINNPSFDAVIGAFPGWYMENFLSLDYTACIGGFPLTEDEEGYLTFICPRWGGKGLVPWLAVQEDMGDMVLALFLEPEKWKGKTVQMFSDGARFEDVTASFEKVTGKKARYTPLPTPADFPTHGNAMLEELRQAITYTQFMGGNFFGNENDLETCKALKKVAVENKKGKKGIQNGNGEVGEEQLTSVERWFEKRFG